jgi:hypothetical protein
MFAINIRGQSNTVINIPEGKMDFRPAQITTNDQNLIAQKGEGGCKVQGTKGFSFTAHSRSKGDDLVFFSLHQEVDIGSDAPDRLTENGLGRVVYMYTVVVFV